jgi:hypothetical protein
LNSKFVGVTDGLGTSSTLSCTGSKKTAPDTPAGAVTTAIRNPAARPLGIAVIVLTGPGCRMSSHPR